MIENKAIIDDFLNDFDAFRMYCDELSYEGETNPYDDVFYPGVTQKIPNAIKNEIIEKLESALNRNIVMNALFLRLSVHGVDAPHQAHTDASMGDYSFMLYMNRLEDCEGGTSFVRHVHTGLSSQPINEKQLKVWQNDHSKREKWERVDMCDMMPNRACIFPASLMHRSEPVGGFGKDAQDGRLVLVGFFS